MIIKKITKIPTNGLVIFSGEGRKKKITKSFIPYKPIRNSEYLCDSRFHTEIIEDLIEEKQIYGYIIIDGAGFLFCHLDGDIRKIIHSEKHSVNRKHRKGGQSAQRFGRITDEKKIAYIRKIAKTANEKFITNNKVNVSGIIVGGPGELKRIFRKSPLLDKYIYIR